MGREPRICTRGEITIPIPEAIIPESGERPVLGLY